MTGPSPKTDENTIYARVQDADLMRWLYGVMADTKQPMREIVERALRFARKSKDFKVPVRKTTAEKIAEREQRKDVKLRAKAAGEA